MTSRRALVLAAILAALAALPAAQARDPLVVDAAGEKWVQTTLKKMSLEQKVGQLLVSSFQSNFLSTDSDAFAGLEKAVREFHVGGFHVFGASELAPPVLLNPAYGTVILGQPLEAASTLNRLQSIAQVPLLNTADFEGGVGFRIAGATAFPRAMAFGAAGDDAPRGRGRPHHRRRGARARRPRQLRAGRRRQQQPAQSRHQHPLVRRRSRSSSAGSRPPTFAACRAAGVMATLKHFPGHGDTDVDSHIGLPVIKHPRERLEQIELPPFRAGIAAGADAVMTGHIEMPALDPTPATPTTLSPPIVDGRAAEGAGVPRPRLHRLDGHAGRHRHARRRAKPPSAPSSPATTSSCIRRTTAPRSRGWSRR